MPDPITSPVPPPTAEVSIRTLETDLAAIAASGGMASAAPQTVSIAAPVHAVDAGHASHFLTTLLSWLAVLLVLVGLAAGGWYVYQRPSVVTPEPVASSTLPATASSTGSLAGVLQTVSKHESLLAKPAASTISFPLIPASGQLKTRYQLMADGLAKIPASARTAELVPTDAAGKPLSFAGYLTAIGASGAIDRSAYESSFENDFTLLAVRGQGGFAAAYLLELKPNQAWIYAAPALRAMETSPVLGNLFFQLPGSLSGPFEDSTVQDQPVRVGTYEKPAGTITYGFFKDRVVITTSRQALDEALLLLCFAPGSC